ncbi:hypothetical protein HO133_003018 [Letharia lupina]|uniref:CT20-domain-containing protein n=1 Tax=Letharia lupina TaxID=560253 RepID=A0A8H6CBX1_9LECA|nr:uncharacterized protein HO133_003018 [Letharia lupina]KAF6220585.1 hypothetical protein HO133_003018 [Letharia lupina]
MAPKKKIRQPSRAASTPVGDVVEQAEETPTTMKSDSGIGIIVTDAWTDEQETSLFKSMVRWKPVGMHKHFRMISISENLRNHGYSSPQNAHTRIPGIWEKLGSLYNLETLDAREDAFGEPIQMDGDPAEQPFCPFALPEDEYRDMMFGKRLAGEGTSSPPLLAHQLSGMSVEGGRAARRYSTVDDTDVNVPDPRSSPASISGQKISRNTRTSKGTRTSLLAEVSTIGGRQGSKGSVDQGTDDGQKDDEDDGEAMGEDENDSKAATLKDTSKASKGAAIKSNASRRSGRKR